MNDKKKYLEVGDEIVVTSHYHGRHIIKVDRVTKTQAICDRTKLRREYYRNYIHAVGNGGNGAPRYHLLEDGDRDSINEEHYRNRAKKLLKGILETWKDQSTKNITAIIDAYNSTEPE